MTSKSSPFIGDVLNIQKQLRAENNALGAEFGTLLIPDVTKLSKSQIHKAELVNASHVFFGEGLVSAKEFLAERKNPYRIDEELSARDHIVALDQNNRAVVAFRGTEPGRNDFNGRSTAAFDISAWGPVAAGLELHHSHFKDARNVMEDTIAKHGRIQEVMGYSLGGAKAIQMGELYAVPQSTLFNPLLGTRFTGVLKQMHSIIRTTEDIASSVLAITPERTNVKVTNILPTNEAINPVVAHDHGNFWNRPSASITKHKVSPTSVPSMIEHVMEISHLKRHFNGQNAIIAAKHIADHSKKLAKDAVGVATGSASDAALVTALDTAQDFLAGQNFNRSKAATTFSNTLKTGLTRGAAGLALSGVVNPIANGAGDIARNLAGGKGLGADVVDAGVSGAVGSATTAGLIEIGGAALMGTEIGATLGLVGVAGGAALGAGIGIVSTLAGYLFGGD